MEGTLGDSPIGVPASPEEGTECEVAIGPETLAVMLAYWVFLLLAMNQRLARRRSISLRAVGGAESAESGGSERETADESEPAGRPRALHQPSQPTAQRVAGTRAGEIGKGDRFAEAPRHRMAANDKYAARCWHAQRLVGGLIERDAEKRMGEPCLEFKRAAIAGARTDAPRIVTC